MYLSISCTYAHIHQSLTSYVSKIFICTHMCTYVYIYVNISFRHMCIYISVSTIRYAIYIHMMVEYISLCHTNTYDGKSICTYISLYHHRDSCMCAYVYKSVHKCIHIHIYISLCHHMCRIHTYDGRVYKSVTYVYI